MSIFLRSTSTCCPLSMRVACNVSRVCLGMRLGLGNGCSEQECRRWGDADSLTHCLCPAAGSHNELMRDTCSITITLCIEDKSCLPACLSSPVARPTTTCRPPARPYFLRLLPSAKQKGLRCVSEATLWGPLRGFSSNIRLGAKG